jgi:TetR/AcrR family transcriptional regulator
LARLRAADYDDKRNALLQVAARLFARDGFDRTSISDIAQAADVSKALLYHYYASKDALLFDIIHEHLLDLVSQVEAADDSNLSPEEHLQKLIATVLFAYRDADTMHKVQINELDKLAEGQQRVIRALERKLVGIVARALARLNPTLEGQGGALLKPITMSLFGILNWSYLWFRDDKPIGRDAYAQLVTRLFVDGAARLTPAAIGERAMATARRLDRP